MLALVKEYIINLWEVRKVNLYGEPCSTQPQSQSSAGDPRDGTVVGGGREEGKFGTCKFSHSGRVTGTLSTCITDDLLCIHSCKLALSTLGAWSMAGLLGQPLEHQYSQHCNIHIIFNPRRACAARVTVVNPRRACARGLLQLSCVCVCLCVCVSAAPANLRTGATTRLTEGIGGMSGTFVIIIKSRFFYNCFVGELEAL